MGAGRADGGLFPIDYEEPLKVSKGVGEGARLKIHSTSPANIGWLKISMWICPDKKYRWPQASV